MLHLQVNYSCSRWGTGWQERKIYLRKNGEVQKGDSQGNSDITSEKVFEDMGITATSSFKGKCNI